jgi:hypothetical protein
MFSRFPRHGFPFSASQFPQIHERRDQKQLLRKLGKPSAEDVAATPTEESAVVGRAIEAIGGYTLGLSWRH